MASQYLFNGGTLCSPNSRCSQVNISCTFLTRSAEQMESRAFCRCFWYNYIKNTSRWQSVFSGELFTFSIFNLQLRSEWWPATVKHTGFSTPPVTVKLLLLSRGTVGQLPVTPYPSARAQLLFTGSVFSLNSCKCHSWSNILMFFIRTGYSR